MKIINQKSDGECGYIAFFNGQKVGLYAQGAWEAKQLATAHFRPRKSQVHSVHVMIAEDSLGEQVVHSTAGI